MPKKPYQPPSIIYREALEKMVRFLRFHGNDRPEVVAAPQRDDYPVLVKVRDHLTWGEELEVPVDLVVLAVGFLPRDIGDLVKMLKISQKQYLIYVSASK